MKKNCCFEEKNEEKSFKIAKRDLKKNLTCSHCERNWVTEERGGGGAVCLTIQN